MKKTYVLFFVIVIITAGAFYYFKIYSQKKVDIWQLVPANAILAFENTNLIENWNEIVDKSIWKTLGKVSYFRTWESGLSKADSLSGKNGSLDKLFRNNEFIISAHITSSNEFDFLFYLDFNDKSGKAIFDKVIKSIHNDRAINLNSRTYLGLELIELADKAKKTSFTFFIYKNVAVGSFTPFLVEDVVRNVSDGFRDTFKSQISTLYGISKLENDEGNIYIDFAKLPDLFAAFLNQEQGTKIKNLTRFTGDTFLDLKVMDHEVLLNGISSVNLTNNKSFIGTFRNQNPGEIKVTDLIPNNTALLYHVAFSDFAEWQSQLSKYWAVSSKEQFQRSLDFEQKYNLNLDWIKGEAANAILETPNKDHPDQLIFIGANDADVAFNEMIQFARKVSQESNDSVYKEIYYDRSIVQIPFAEFPSRILGNYFTGFENSFVIHYKDYLVVGNSMQVVKHFLNELENENNWGKSVRQINFLENTLNEANFSLMINTSYCWQMIIDNLNNKWANQFKKYEFQLKSFDRIAIQISNLDQRFYTSIAVGHQEKMPSLPKSNRLKRIQSVYAISPIITKPYIVKNHNNNKFEVLLQDSLNILYQISNEGAVLWGDSIRDKIVSEIHQIDYYKNAKLQYLFATKNKIHLLDRNGDYVKNFPIKLNEGVELEHLSVIDYDNSRRYRIMAVSTNGDIYLFDIEGNNLEGWNPRSIGGRLSIPGFHIRVKGGDCMVALQQNGVLNVMNRRGKMYPGFPIDLKTQVNKGLFVNIGNDFNSTRLVMVTDEGEVIEVNLKGKIVKREQLYKPTKESKFWLVKDALKKTYVIARQEYNKISILNRNGETVMEKNIISSGNLEVQYYNFSSDNQITVILDPVQEFAYIYGKDNQQITFEPLESSFFIGLLYSSRRKEYKLYSCFNNNFTVETFK